MFGTGPTHASADNMSKIQLMNMHGFCRIIDLGKSHFNFLSKNYSSKLHPCFAKVVGLVTHSTTKLDLKFFSFFYDVI
jgi:hypothetical protein